MGQQQSKDELLYQQVNYGNVEGIKALRSEGAGLEWIDKEGKTPLIAACMNSELYNVAKTLIELGANVNAYRPGRHAGTPLHHAAKRGLEQTVKLLLSHGANALVMNDDCQTPVDVARIKRCTNVVRAIESHICLFSGWLRELYGPGFLEVLAPQLLSRKVWVVVLPCGSRNLSKPFKLELAIYSGLQDLLSFVPNATRVLHCKDNRESAGRWNAHSGKMVGTWMTGHHWRWTRLREPLERKDGSGEGGSWIHGGPLCIGTFRAISANQCLMLIGPSHIPLHDNETLVVDCLVQALNSSSEATYPQDAQPRTHIALWKANLEEPKFNQPDPAVIIYDISNKSRIKFAPASETDKQLLQQFCNACKGIPQVMHPNFPFNRPVPVVPATAPSSAEDVDSHSGWGTSAASAAQTTSSGCEIQEAGPGGNPTQNIQNQSDIPATVETTPSLPTTVSLPSAPPVENLVIDNGPIQYPSVDFSPIDLPSHIVENLPGREDERKEDMDASSSSSCVICLDAPVEGACIPCGHMAGCMSCLSEVKAKKWGCPVCRAKIDQIVRLYAV
ncbi:hypothetical protein Acr_00g0015600 [Actinidia rufa]|uniref:RING-type domain-containing protein n=1 Tax=Actinidia rufa TaxID=165716 RepID=A0A7J0DAM0_9ERIC|nr:hypothetical protein Acr_00g0015600 [Actinidia rufa]